MSAAEKAIAALEAAGKAAKEKPWTIHGHHIGMIAAPLAAVARAAMAYHEDGYLGADGMQHHTTYACARLRAALDALEAAAEGVV